MDESFRSFIAIEIPEEIRNKVIEFQNRLKSIHDDIKWVRVESLHLTLKFLGDVEENRLNDLTALIHEAIQEFEPFEVDLGGSGVFPNRHRPNVLWIGILKGKEYLRTMASVLNRSLIKMGFDEEKRKYHPHLTVGRVRSRQKIIKTIELMESLSFLEQSFWVQELILMKSDLKPSGAEYTPLEHFKL